MIGIHVTNGARVGLLEDIVTPPDWTDAVCRGHAPELWFPETRGGSGDTYATARAICDGCPLKDACLEYALSRETASYRYGMWGGLDPNERSTLARQRPKPLVGDAPTWRPQCGTETGYRAHQRAGERVCDACGTGNARACADRRRRRR